MPCTIFRWSVTARMLQNGLLRNVRESTALGVYVCLILLAGNLVGLLASISIDSASLCSNVWYVCCCCHKRHHCPLSSLSASSSPSSSSQSSSSSSLPYSKGIGFPGDGVDAFGGVPNCRRRCPQRPKRQRLMRGAKLVTRRDRRRLCFVTADVGCNPSDNAWVNGKRLSKSL